MFFDEIKGAPGISPHSNMGTTRTLKGVCLVVSAEAKCMLVLSKKALERGIWFTELKFCDILAELTRFSTINCC